MFMPTLTGQCYSWVICLHRAILHEPTETSGDKNESLENWNNNIIVGKRRHGSVGRSADDAAAVFLDVVRSFKNSTRLYKTANKRNEICMQKLKFEYSNWEFAYTARWL